MQQITFKAMGCQMQALLDADTGEAARALAEVPGWFEDWERHLSRFRPGSELSQLNAASELAQLNGGRGPAMPVSPAFWQVIELALQAERESGGLVTPVLLGELEAAGYDRSFDSLPASAPQLPAFGAALVDAGGDIAVSGPRLRGEPWLVSVADPLHPGSDLESLPVARGGIATSGRDYRRWQRGGRWYHHILDPRTGQPAETDVLSATIAAPSAARAEVAAKVALILGSRARLAWLEARPDFAGLLVLDDGQVLRTARLPAPLVKEH